MNLIQEPELRAFIKCSEYKAFGGKVELPIKTMALEFTYIKLILDKLKYKEKFDFQFALNQAVLAAEKEFTKSKSSVLGNDEDIRHISLNALEIFGTLLKPSVYLPVFGPFSYNVNISKSVLQLDIASLLLPSQNNPGDSKTRTYHAVTFSPYSDPRDMKNDPVQHIKLLTLSMANPFKTLKDKPRIKLHILNTTGGKNVNYTFLDYVPSMNRKDWASYLEKLMVQIETGYHMPVVPCQYKCQFKSQCSLNPQREL